MRKGCMLLAIKGRAWILLPKWPEMINFVFDKSEFCYYGIH